ncbi:MAG: beta-propeller fold lactonase family protein [Acidobacteriales bacterium]|nr:beta-propeller fold lactonase family protein [Terriglobales bacterium]
MSKKIPGLFALLAFLGLSLFLINCGTSSSRPAGVLYVLSQGANNVGSYAINLDNGKLSQINTNAASDTTPSSILLDPSGKVAFVLNTGSNSITAYTTNSDGSLSSPTSTALPVQHSVAMARDAAGAFLFVVSQGSIPLPGVAPCPHPEPNTECPALSVFAIQSGSTSLTAAGDPIALNRVPTSVFPAAGPNGTLLYIASNQDLSGISDNTVSAFNVDGSGLATEQTNSPYTTASNPSSVLAVKTTPVGGTGGLFVYVTNVTTNNVNVYQACTELNATCTAQDVTANNNTLLAVGSPVSVGLDPVAMTADPTNNFLYVVNHGSSTVSGFRINPTTGVLSALNPAAASTGASPVAVTMHSSGKFLFVSNNASSNVSGFNVSTTNGALSTAINVTSSAQPAGLVAK